MTAQSLGSLGPVGGGDASERLAANAAQPGGYSARCDAMQFVPAARDRLMAQFWQTWGRQ